jgi:hypothetical protein
VDHLADVRQTAATALLPSAFRTPSTRAVLDRLWLLGACALFAVLLNWSYANVESQLFAYVGYRYRLPPWPYLAFGYVASLLPILWLPTELRRPSDFANWVLYATFLVPMMFFPFHWVRGNPLDVLPLVVLVFLNFALLGLLLRLKPIRLPQPTIDQTALRLWLIVLIVVLIGLVVFTTGFRFTVSFEDIYERRVAARRAVPGGSLVAYGIALLASSFAPIAVLLGLQLRKYALALLGLAGLLAVFSFAGTKTSAFTMPVLFLFLWLAKRVRRFSLVMMTGAALAVGLSAVLFVEFDAPGMSSWFTRRLIDSKAISTCQYWEAFRNDPVYMMDSNLVALVGERQAKAKTYQIGEEYEHGRESNANANAWASAFANFGYLGMFVITLLVALQLLVLDGFALNGNFEIHCVMAAFFATIWGEQALESTFLSNGVAASFVLLYLLGGAARGAPRAAPASS